MGKFLVMGVALLFVGVLHLSTANMDGVEIPFLGSAKAENAAAKSAESIGTPSAVSLPESDPATWFGDAASADSVSPGARWADIQQFAAAASTPGGWSEACKQAGAAAGPDRASNPELGALGCSDDPTVTELQQFAIELLATRAELSLWMLGIPGHDSGVVAARLAEVRHACENGLASRLAGPDSAYSQACALSLASTTLPADATALEAALGEAYALVAADLAARDPSIDPESPPVAAPAAPSPTAS